jgi:HPt (histidine-containing phosphotransfer) domain-containing protein
MSGLKKYLVLPKEVTAFEQGYLTKLNKIALYFFYAHIPVFMLVAWVAGTGPLSALGLTLSLLIVPTVCQYILKNERAKSMVYGVTAMCMGGLLVHFGQGAVQIEMHFYFFALLAMLCMFANPAVNIAAAVTVALHHLVVWLLHPASVFNYEASYWVVAVHAGFVVLETVAACFISRRFFDDVIGLEKIVQARTKEVHLILNNIGQGFMTIDLNGIMSEERSSIVATWFGESGGSRTFSEYIRSTDATAAEWFELGLEALREGALPTEVSLGQLPKRMVVRANVLELTYNPIQNEAGALEKLLVIISDITSVVKREQAESQQKQLMQIFQNIMRDKLGFVQFLTEADDMVETVVRNKFTDLSHLKRIIHTIKGSSGLFGMTSVANLCHELESEIMSESKAPDQQRLNSLQTEWNRIREGLDSVLGKRTDQSIEINDEDYEAILRALLNREHPDKIAKLVRSWKLEAGQRRLEFIKQQAESLAQRLGKKDIEVSVQSNNIRFDGTQWASFWSTFTHVLRNAIDHGIETQEERSLVGKTGRGSIHIETYIEEGEFIIAVEDDGRGIDWQAIADKAMKAQLPHKSEKDLINAIFQGGISTKSIVTQYSGRGIGLGAVREECVKRGGLIELNSKAGKGTKILFRFPLNESVYQEELSPKVQQFK